MKIFYMEVTSHVDVMIDESVMTQEKLDAIHDFFMKPNDFNTYEGLAKWVAVRVAEGAWKSQSEDIEGIGVLEDEGITFNDDGVDMDTVKEYY